MKIDSTGRVTLEAPADYRAFTYRGVEFTRLTGLHEAGVYVARVLKSGNEYNVVSGNSNRFPWTVAAVNGRRLGIASDLVAACRKIADFEEELDAPGSDGPTAAEADDILGKRHYS